MEEFIQTAIHLLNESIESEDWALVSEAISQLENAEFDEFEDKDY
jgi:hypothetical protein